MLPTASSRTARPRSFIIPLIYLNIKEKQRTTTRQASAKVAVDAHYCGTVVALNITLETGWDDHFVKFASESGMQTKSQSRHISVIMIDLLSVEHSRTNISPRTITAIIDPK